MFVDTGFHKWPSSYDEHVWDYMAAKSRLSEDGMMRWRMFLGVDSLDCRLDQIIRHEYQRAASRRQRMSYPRMMEIIRGPQS